VGPTNIEPCGLVWVRLVDNGPRPLPEMSEWDDSDYLRILPDSVTIGAAPVEGFFGVSHFAFILTKSADARQ